MQCSPGAKAFGPQPIIVGLATACSWIGLFLHNLISLPALTLLSPENFLPALLSAILFAAWWRWPVKSTSTLLLPWGLLQLLGGAILTVLPLRFLPFAPAQTPVHYLAHTLYGLAQLPLIVVTISHLRHGRSPTMSLEAEVGDSTEGSIGILHDCGNKTMAVRGMRALAGPANSFWRIPGLNTFLLDIRVHAAIILSEKQRTRIAEINQELESIEAEKAKRQAKGKSIEDLEKRQEELERLKHEQVEQIADIWSS